MEGTFRLRHNLLALLGLCIFVVLFSGACSGDITVGAPGCERCADKNQYCLEQNERGVCVACLENKHCQTEAGSTKLCEKNKCICGSDKDCSDGFRCAGKDGCVECRSDSHCPKDRPACVANSCQLCKQGEKRACQPDGANACKKGTQTCKPNNTWTECKDYHICEAHEKCENEKCVLDCPEPSPCKADEKKCLTSESTLPGTYKVCTKDKKGCPIWGSEKTCGAKEYCTGGQCTPYNCPPPECKLDETKCVGSDKFRICEKNNQGCLVWSKPSDCKTGTQCRDKLGKCTVCVPKEEQSCRTNPNDPIKGVCKPGKKVCSADGSKFGLCIGEVTPQKEICNGKDDDCDGRTDEDFPKLNNPCEAGKGECKKTGKFTCNAAGTALVCSATPGKPTPELCNGKDDDCDGFVDDGFKTLKQACTVGKGECQAKGIIVCSTDGKSVVCNAQPKKPSPELCDQKDNDCDGQIDETFTLGKACTSGQGECKRAGKTICASGGRTVACNAQPGKPVKEVCDGKDNDCDGQLDEDFTNLQKACTIGQGGCKGTGVYVCHSNRSTTICNAKAVGSKPETCDNKDNDCDGLVDENLVRSCYSGPANTQGKGICKAGRQSCLKGIWQSSCTGEVKPGAETCDGKDNNCNGQIDDNIPGMGAKCNVATAKGPCANGKRTCHNGKVICKQTVFGSLELCNDKIDNDCDGQTDEGCVAVFFVKSSINTDTGRIDGVPSTGWKGQGRFQLRNMTIPQGARVKVTGKNVLSITTSGNLEIIGTLDLSGQKGGSVTCQSLGPGAGGLTGGGGSGAGGTGGKCDPKGVHTKGSNGLGSGAGQGGQVHIVPLTGFGGGSSTAGGGGGAGHAAKGVDGLPSTRGGKGGAVVGSATTVTPGSGGGGGGCSALELNFLGQKLGVYTPGAGGGSGGGAVKLESTAGNVTISGNILAAGGDGGSAATCPSAVGNATGGGGAGGSGGSILIRAKNVITIKNTAYLTAQGGKGNGQSSAKGGNGSAGRIRFQDGDGKVAYPAARVAPLPTVVKY